MAQKISIRNTNVLVKLLNCLERILFIDNRWMKDYEDLKNGINREFEGPALYLKKISETLQKNNASILIKKLPDKSERKQFLEQMNCIVLESVNHSFYANESKEDKQYIIVACPDVERVFHFKISSMVDANIFQNAKIKDFSYYPLLPRIKIYTRNFETSSSYSDMSNLKFLYTLVGDANIQTNSYKLFQESVYWNELVSDPSSGVQVGNLGVYHIAPLKIIELKRDIEDLRQLILIVEEFNGKKFEICMKTETYRDLFKEFPKEQVLSNPLFLRGFIFQGFGEDFRHLIRGEIINEKEFDCDSLFSYVRFRKVIQRESISKLSTSELPDLIEDKGEHLFYFSKGYSSEMFDAAEQFKKGSKDYSLLFLLRKYHDFQKLCNNFHPDWEEVYTSKINSESLYQPIEIIDPNPWGIHRSFLREPIQRLTFYAKNRKLRILCTDCFNYKDYIKTKDIPAECPRCHSKTFVSLKREEDEALIKESMKSKTVDKESQEYMKMSSLSIKFSKFLFYSLNFTGLALSTCVKMLNGLEDFFFDEKIFFEKLYKISQEYHEGEDIPSIIYKLNKNET